MSFLLDTNICSAHLRRPGGLAHRFLQHSGRLFTSSIVLAELYVWAYKRPDPAKSLEVIDQLLLRDLTVLDFDAPSALEFGRLRRIDPARSHGKSRRSSDRRDGNRQRADLGDA